MVSTSILSMTLSKGTLQNCANLDFTSFGILCSDLQTSTSAIIPDSINILTEC